MRNLVTIAIVALVCLICPINPLIGLAGYYWFALMRPDILAWSGPNNYSLYIAIVTLLSNLPRAISNLSVVANSWICRLFLLFGACVGLSGMMAVRPDLCVESLSLFARVAVMALLIPLAIGNLKDLRLFVLVVAGSIGLLGAKYGLAGLLGGGARFAQGFGGMMSDNNTMALAFAMAVPLCWFARLLSERKWVRAAFAVGALLNAAAVVFTHSRGGILAVAVAMLVMTWRSKHKALAALVVFGAVGGAGFLVRDTIVARLSTLKAPVEESSANSRLILARAALRLWLDYPIFGVGFTERNAMMLIEKYVPEEYAEEYAQKMLHNTYIQVLADTGIIGFAAYLMLLITAYRQLGASARRRRSAGLDDAIPMAIQSSLIAYMVGSAFLSRTVFDLSYILMLTGAAWLNLEYSEAPAIQAEPAPPVPAAVIAQPAPIEPQPEPAGPRTARERRALLRRESL